MNRIAVLALCLCLTACSAAVSPPAATTPSAPSVPPPGSDTCSAAPYSDLVGQDATALERVLIMRPVRVIRPGMVITMDFRPQRINFEIGTDSRIRRVYCG